MSIIMPRDKVVYNLGSVERIPLGEGRSFRIEDTLIAIFRTRKSEVFATQATCPHKGGPLADGILDRLVHNAHRIEMRGESMRKQQGANGEK